MPTIIKTEKYIKSDANKNNNKVWLYELYDDNSVTCKWGRIGETLADLTKSFSSLSAAEKFIDGKIKEKLKGRNGEIPYRKIETLGDIKESSSIATKSLDNSALLHIATKQIKTNNPIVDDLVKYLTKMNAHQITASTGGKITYNDTTGLFSTPLGIITQANIDEANKLLSDIHDVIVGKNNDEKKLINLTNEYLMLVPSDIGRHRLNVGEFWCDENKIQLQKQILDGLQTSYASAITNKDSLQKTVDIPEEKVFELQLDLISDNDLIKKLSTKYESSKQSMHSSYSYRVKTIYGVTIESERDRFEKLGKNIGNINQFFHGTSTQNLLSIMKQGLIVPPANASYCAGRNFGNGVYFAPSSSKSLNYSIGYWGGRTADRIFMFIADVAMGNPYTPKYGSYDLRPPTGYHSVWAKAGQSGVQNDECIVYDLKQCTLKYLLELHK
jgi:poly [ADP-ribose] polymerase 2/3/4